ncbi:MAG: HEPN domain-containing protein [Candidatus Cloacimonadales bacterium]|nr:HEPN domain-containing protein [Candidatus Cloacimonadales bacterium]
MKRNDVVKEWMQRAQSNLARANLQNIPPGVLYEDLCFDCQQAVEKALKGLLRFYNINIPRIHSIGKLLSLLEDNDYVIPDYVKEGIILTDYAVQTRYPGDYEPVFEEEFITVLEISNKIFDWINSIISK